jgi:hypothetical protein
MEINKVNENILFGKTGIKSKKEGADMRHNRFAIIKFAWGLLVVGLLFAGLAAAQSAQVKGLITGRSGATMSVRTQDSETVIVALTTDTQVQEVEGAFNLRKKELGLTALIPGLPV